MYQLYNHLSPSWKFEAALCSCRKIAWYTPQGMLCGWWLDHDVQVLGLIVNNPDFNLIKNTLVIMKQNHYELKTTLTNIWVTEMSPGI